MANIKFEDRTLQVISAMSDTAYRAVEEALGEFEAQIKRNTPVGKVHGSQLKNSWTHQTRKIAGGVEGNVGSPLERAIWIEYGTGEYALNGDGRTGGWYIPIGEGKGQISQAVVDAYHFKTVEGKDGIKFAFTYGMQPKRPVHTAYTKFKPKCIKHMQSIFKGGMK